MTTRIAPRLLVSLLLTLASGLAGAACVSVVGTVRLVPEFTSCGVADAAKPEWKDLFTKKPAECFTVQLVLAGFPVATGYAGVTAEPVFVDGGPGATPAMGYTPAMIPDAGGAPRQVIQTARSVVSLGLGSRRTTLYTTDVIVAQPNGQLLPKVVTEQILISDTNHAGAYANVTGHLNVLGNSIGQLAPVVGQICTK